MSIKERIKFTIMVFCMVTTGMIIVLFIKSMVSNPTINFQPKLLGQILLIAFLISTISLFRSSRQMTNAEVIIRRIIHLSAIIAIVIGFSYLFDSSDTYDPGTLVITVLVYL